MQTVIGNPHTAKGSWAARVLIFADVNLRPGEVSVVGKTVILWFRNQKTESRRNRERGRISGKNQTDKQGMLKLSARIFGSPLNLTY